MAYNYVCGKCETKTTKPEPYGDYPCSSSGCNGHLAYYIDMPFSPAPVGRVHTEAMGEIEGHDKVLAKAVTMVFNKSARGRSAPGTTNVNHIHVGGNAQLNLLFDTVSYTVLGLVNGHMDKNMSPSVSNQATKVSQRYAGSSVSMVIDGDNIMRSN
jgi:hypothetical protein